MTEQNTQNGSTSPLTDPVPQVVRQHTPRDVDMNERMTSEAGQVFQCQEQSSSDMVPQLATAPSFNFVGSKGPVQLGTGSAVINNPSYNYNSQHHHHHYHSTPFHPAYIDYLRWVEQNAAALGAEPSHPGLPSCPLPQRPAGDQFEHQTSQTDRKSFHAPHHHGHNSFFHAPPNCQDCLHFHNNDHRPLVESRSVHPESGPQHFGLPHHSVHQFVPSTHHVKQMESTRGYVAEKENREDATPEDTETQNQSKPPKTSGISADTQSSRDVRHHVITGQKGMKLTVNPRGKNRKQTEVNKYQQSKGNLGQMSSNSSAPRTRDDIPMETCTNLKGRNEAKGPFKTAKTTDYEYQETFKSQNNQAVSESVETRQVCSGERPEAFCIIDSKGQALESGDFVWVGYDRKGAIYVGNQEIVQSDGWSVNKKRIKMTEPYGLITATSVGECQLFSPRQRVSRALSRVGTRFTEGDGWWIGNDFPVWVFTGMVGREVHNKGFRIQC